MRLDELPVLKLKKYATLMHDLYCSFDLAHLILEAIDRKVNTSIAPAYLQKLIASQSPQAHSSKNL